MKLFLDTSVLLAACGSEHGTSRELFRLAPLNAWTLMATPYVLEETERNLSKLPRTAESIWQALKLDLVLREDILTLNQRGGTGWLALEPTGVPWHKRFAVINLSRQEPLSAAAAPVAQSGNRGHPALRLQK